MQVNESEFLDVMFDLAENGAEFSPRGQRTLEIENYSYILSPYVRFPSFTVRKLQLGYIKQEFLWYLRGDRFDLSILEHAKIWQGLIQPDGGLNSNYGQYIFNPKCNQFQRVIDILKEDKDSRRATISILQAEHTLTPTTDQPCTYSIRFSIRDDKLSMTVRMRSQDAIFGMGNDAPCFSFIHEMVHIALTEFYPNLVLGVYNHSADSFHVYERHFKMLSTITGKDVLTGVDVPQDASLLDVQCPKISSPAEVKFLINNRDYNVQTVPAEFLFAKWLLSDC